MPVSTRATASTQDGAHKRRLASILRSPTTVFSNEAGGEIESDAGTAAGQQAQPGARRQRAKPTSTRRVTSLYSAQREHDEQHRQGPCPEDHLMIDQRFLGAEQHMGAAERAGDDQRRREPFGDGVGDQASALSVALICAVMPIIIVSRQESRSTCIVRQSGRMRRGRRRRAGNGPKYA